MRFMMIVKADPSYEAGGPPNPALLAAIGKLSEEMTKAGVLLQSGGLLPSSKGARVRASGGKLTVTDGPFAETKELIGGFAILEAASKEEAIQLGKSSCSSMSMFSGRPTKARWRFARCSIPRAPIAPDACPAAVPHHSQEKPMQKITPFLWYSKEAEEAAAFYASVFPDSRVSRVTALPSESPSGPPGSVKVVEFVLFGQPFIAMSAGPLDPFNHAVSFVVNCDDQAELDRYWNALLEGGSAEQCGWLKDRFGLSWQIVPTVLGEMMAEPDRAKAKRASDAMMKMVKIDIAALRAAFAGTTKASR